MAMGYCLACDKLVALRQGGYKPLSLEKYWYPYPHWGKDGPGKPCPGEKRGI